MSSNGARLERPEPHNIPAEEYALCVAMQSPAAIDAALSVGLDPADFYRDSHAHTWRACLRLHQSGHVAHPVQVAELLEQLDQLDQCGGRDRIREIASLAEPPAMAAQHARTIRRAAGLRRVARQARRIHEAATAGAQLDDVEQQLRDLASSLELGHHADQHRYRVSTAAAFLDSFEEQTAALVGELGETLIPAGGLLILGGEAGAGKTTLALDAVAHLAAGTPWLNYPIGRPLRVLIVENEGPRPQFRAKLKQKADAWQGPDFLPNVHVWEEPWARFSFANPADRQALREHTRRLQTDLVIADPLDSLGITGAGTPDDVRSFVAYLRECGLHDPTMPLAYFLLHHFGKQEHGSIVARLRGAWGDHADTVIGLELADGHASKLTWGKLRHATPPAKSTTLLVWNLATRGFTPVDVAEQATQRRAERLNDAQTAATAHIHEHPGDTTNTIKRAIGEQLGIDRTTVETALKTAPGIHSQPGPRNALLWYPGPAPEQLTTTSLDPQPVKTPVSSSEVPRPDARTTSLDPPRSPLRERGVESEVKSSPTKPAPSEDTPKDTPSAPMPGRSGAFARAEGWIRQNAAQPAGFVEAELLARGLTAGEVRELLALALELAGGDFGAEVPA